MLKKSEEKNGQAILLCPREGGPGMLDSTLGHLTDPTSILAV